LCPAPVLSVELYVSSHTPLNGAEHADVSSATLIENQPSLVRCVSLGGYPPPTMQIQITGSPSTDITDLMSTGRNILASGERGLRVFQFRTQVWTSNYLVSRLKDGHSINCVVSVAGLKPVAKNVRLNIMCQYSS
jgi:hypothetical protein